MQVKIEACGILLGFHVDHKVKTKKIENILSRLHVSMPEKRVEKERSPFIPECVLQKRERENVIKQKR